MQAVGAIGKSGKAGEIDGSRRKDDIAIALANRDSLRAYTCFLSLLLLTSSLSRSAETLGLETSLTLPALFDFLKSYTCFCHVYSRGRGRQLACVRLQTPVSLAHACYLTCDLYCKAVPSPLLCRLQSPAVLEVSNHLVESSTPHCSIPGWQTQAQTSYLQGHIEPPKAAREHAASYSARVDCEVLSVTKHRIQIHRRKCMVLGNALILPHRAGCVME